MWIPRLEDSAPPVAIDLLELWIEEQQGEGFLVVVSVKAVPLVHVEPEREVDREGDIDAFTFHRRDEVVELAYKFRVNLTDVFSRKDLGVVADHVHAVLGELSRKVINRALIHAHDAGPGVYGPEAHRLPRLAVNKPVSVDDDETTLTCHLLVEIPQVDRRFGERVWLWLEGEPSLGCPGQFGARLEFAAGGEGAGGEEEAIKSCRALVGCQLYPQPPRPPGKLDLPERDPVRADMLAQFHRIQERDLPSAFTPCTAVEAPAERTVFVELAHEEAIDAAPGNFDIVFQEKRFFVFLVGGDPVSFREGVLFPCILRVEPGLGREIALGELLRLPPGAVARRRTGEGNRNHRCPERNNHARNSVLHCRSPLRILTPICCRIHVFEAPPETPLPIYGLKPGLPTPNSCDNPFVVRPSGRECRNASPMCDPADARRRGCG